MKRVILCLNRLLVFKAQISYLYFSVIPFKNEMAMELLEKGRVRFWAQMEKFTSACQVEYVFNDVIIEEGKVGRYGKINAHVLF